MRINKLKITSKWKNLEGFCVDFDDSCDVTVLIGRNGSAKTNLAEALINIFSKLNLKKSAPFSYELDYKIAGHQIFLNGVEGKTPTATVDGKKVTATVVRELYSPRYVVGYYSGTSDRFKELFEEHDKLALNKTLVDNPDNDKLDLSSFICARPIHGLFSLLAFYYSDDVEVCKFLEKLPRIEAFDSLLIVLNKPYWAKNNSEAEDFWGARGPVRDLLEAIKRHSLAPFSRTVRTKVDFRRHPTKEFLYLYLPDLQALQALAREYGKDPGALFQALDTMRLSEFIDESSFRVKVRVKGSDDSIHTRQLSEGEQQLLTVLGLMRFTRNAESLYFLDEPDTHLNPAWGVDYLEHLRNIGEIDKNSHTILATHDPLLVSGLRKNEIRVLHRNQKGQIVAKEPDESPRGRGVAGVLTSPLFGLESQLDPYSLRVLKRIYEISSEKKYPNQQRDLARLRKLVPGLTPDEISPDPYRNIARMAYEIVVDRIVSSDENPDWKIEAIDKLSSKLYDAVRGGQK
jgi:predicted ATPase